MAGLRWPDSTSLENDAAASRPTGSALPHRRRHTAYCLHPCAAGRQLVGITTLRPTIRGCPLQPPARPLDVMSGRISVHEDYRVNRITAIETPDHRL
jgi:hypothetical protein